MTERLAGFIRVLKRLTALLAAVLVILLVAASFMLHQGIRGPNLTILRHLTARLGILAAGQRTEHVELDVRLAPEAGLLSATATLSVRSLQDGRRRFYFLLNDGLNVGSVTVAGNLRGAQPKAYRLWLLTIVDTGVAIAQDERIDLTFEYAGRPATGWFGSPAASLSADSVLLGVETFWYPNDVQGFFTADVTVTAPMGMTVVHNGREVGRVARGGAQEVRWSTERPIGGMALVAGAYRSTQQRLGATTYQVHLAPDVDLDGGRIIELMQAAHDTLTSRFGASGFTRVTLFVNRTLRRAFNDGSGLLGTSIRYFRAGDYGFGLLAHEIAHNWWGGTVAEKWLTPGSGGEWIVEGFAGFSSLVATEAIYGPEASRRRLAGEFFDPANQTSLASMSVLDNALAEATARDTIYRKGAYVATMLRHVLGDDLYFEGLRQFLDRYRYQQVTDVDLQQVLEEVSQQELGQFFEDWVRSDRLADLSLDGTSPAEATVNNLGAAAIPGEISVWTFKTHGGPPQRTRVRVGDLVRLAADDDAILDPQLAWADMQRENNRYPRQRRPVYVAAGDGRHAITIGEAFPWVRATVSASFPGEDTKRVWDFERGMARPPVWTPDGLRLVASVSEAPGVPPAIFTLDAAGARQRIGVGQAPAAARDGTVYAAQDDCLVRFATDGSVSRLICRETFALDLPLPSPDGDRIVYTAALRNQMEIRVVGADGGNDRLLVPWDRDRVLYQWSLDGTRLYAVIGGSWDWQIWEIPLEFEPVRILASGAAAIGGLALSPDGAQLAFTAAPELDYPSNRRQLYLLDLQRRSSRHIDLPSSDLSELAWQDADTLLVVATAVEPERAWTLPAFRSVKRVHLGDGSVEDVE